MTFQAGSLTSVRASSEVTAKAVVELTRAFGNRCVTNQSVRDNHAHTRTYIAPQPPDVVIFPLDEAEVVTAVKIAARYKLPIIPFGIGSSLEGQVNAPVGGISIDTSQMKRIIAVYAEDMNVIVEPGVTRKELNATLRDKGVFFPVDPGADATIGGMTATRASGTNAVRYGTMKDVVLALRVVLASGEIVTTARRAKKTSAGYDLTHLFVGSEGTLGVITEITLKLSGIPEAISAATCSFPTVKAAADAASMAIQAGIPLARVELMDALAVKATNNYSKLSLPEQPLLLLEFHGTQSSVEEQAVLFGQIAEDHGGSSFEWTTKPEDRTRLWQARHDSYWACLALMPGAVGVATDVCVPISRLADCIGETHADLEAHGIVGPIAGHVGDGNFHVMPLFEANNDAALKVVKDFCDRLVQRAIAMDGTCTGEHGIGQGKMKYLEKELGIAALDAMRSIKRALDPDNLMNPMKIMTP